MAEGKKPESANRNLALRLATAAVAIPALLALIFVAPAQAWLAFVTLSVIVGSMELYGLVHPDDAPSRVVCILVTAAMPPLLVFAGDEPRVLLAVLLGLPLFAQILVLTRLGAIEGAALRIAASSFGPLYLGAGLGTLALVRFAGGEDGPSFVLLALMLAWLSDTGAYFAGRFLGKRKLYPAVSPKKTVAGAVGGLGGAVAAGLLAATLTIPSLPIAHAVVLSLVAGGLGQAGDLGESLLKRSFGVKDSGGIVPGHGGILDRVDAVVVTGSFCLLYVLFIR